MESTGFDRNWDQDPNDPDTPVATSSNPWEEPTAAPSQRQNSEGSGPSATDHGTETEEESVAAENARAQETRVADRALSEMGPPPRKSPPTTRPAEIIDAGQPTEIFPAPQALRDGRCSRSDNSSGSAELVSTGGVPTTEADLNRTVRPKSFARWAPPLRLLTAPHPIAREAAPPPSRRAAGRTGLTQEELTHFRVELEPILNLERVRQDYARRGIQNVSEEEQEQAQQRFLQARE